MHPVLGSCAGFPTLEGDVGGCVGMCGHDMTCSYRDEGDVRWTHRGPAMEDTARGYKLWLEASRMSALPTP